MDLTQLLTVYKDFGVAGLFILLYCITVWKFYSALIDQKKELVAVIEKYATALDQGTNAINRSTTTMENVGRSLEDLRKQSSEFIAFVRGRDEGKSGR